MADKEKMLQEAVDAGQSGDLAHARELLLKLLKNDNKEPLYWLLMSTCVDSNEERIYCLHNVLKLDPENSAAKHDLKLLSAPLPGKDPEGSDAELQDDWQTSEIAAPNLEKKKKAPKVEPWPITNILGAIVLGVAVIYFLSYAVSNGFINLESSPESTPNSIPGILISSPTSTRGNSQTPGSSPQVASSETATPEVSTAQASSTSQLLIVPRDPQDLLDATYTPTPRYVNTPHPDSSFFQEGLIAFEAGNWLEVISSMEGHLSGQPASADAEYYIGEALMNLNIYVNARDAFSRAIAIDQSFAAAYLGRAQASIAENLTDSSAITDLNTALLLDSDFTNAYIARSSYYLDKADTERALEDLAQAEGLNPLSPQVHALKAVIYTSLENYDFALSSAQRAFILDVTLFPNYLILANAYLELERPNDALELMQTYLSFKADNGEAWQILGIAFVQLNEAQLALESFDRALELDSVLAKASYYRGLAYFQDGVANAAIPKYRIAIQGEPDWFEPRIALAEALLLSGDPGAAFFEVNSSGALAITDQQLINFYYWRATILESLGQESNALADWQKILSYPEELVPEDWLQSAIERTQSP